MPHRALDTARTLTVSAVAAAALGTAAVGVHLATDHQAAQAAGRTTPSTDKGRAPQPDLVQPAPQQDQQGGGGGLFSGFSQIIPPVGGGGSVHSGSRGS